MKLMSLAVPVLILSLVIVSVWGLGLLAVRASAVSTQASIDLLRMHLQVARLHDQLLRHSKQSLGAHLEALLPGGAPPAAGSEAGEEEGPVRPWPSLTGETPGEITETAPPAAAEAQGAASALEEGLRQARPALGRLINRLDRALPTH
ncbi:MAG TPA: hypothetical protein VGP73_20310 [Thermoanaerobaculia bacterium]